MSESSKMGLFGSKEENTRLSSDQANKDESPERYAPYSVDSDSETYDTEALSIMDINDIIGVQSEPVDSTLESEIAALSKIITDSKSEIADKNIINKNLNVNTVENSPSINLFTNSPDKQSHSSVKNSTDSQLGSSEVDTPSNVVSIDKNTNQFTQLDDTSTNFNIKETGENCKNSDVKEVLSINKSLQLIGDAYTSEDSQEFDEARVEEPKIVFSCKPLVDKQSSKVEEVGNLEGIESVDVPVDIPVDVPPIVGVNIETVEKSSLESTNLASNNDNKLLDQVNNEIDSCELTLNQAKTIPIDSSCPEDDSPVEPTPIIVSAESKSSENVQSSQQDEEWSLKEESDPVIEEKVETKPENEAESCPADLNVNNVESCGIDSGVKEDSTSNENEVDNNNQNIAASHAEETSSDVTQNLESLITSAVTNEDVESILDSAEQETNEAKLTANVEEAIDQLTPAINSEYPSRITDNLSLEDVCENSPAEDQMISDNSKLPAVEINEESVSRSGNQPEEDMEVVEEAKNQSETLEIMDIDKPLGEKDKIFNENEEILESIIECNKSELLPSCSLESGEEITKDVIEENALECSKDALSETEKEKIDLKGDAEKPSENIKLDGPEIAKPIENVKMDLNHDNQELLFEVDEISDINNVQKNKYLVAEEDTENPPLELKESLEELNANLLEPAAQSPDTKDNQSSSVEISKLTEESEADQTDKAVVESEDRKIQQDDPEEIKNSVADLELNLDIQEPETEMLVENSESSVEAKSEIIQGLEEIMSTSKDSDKKTCQDSQESEALESPLVGLLDLDLTTSLEKAVNSNEVIVNNEIIEEPAEQVLSKLEQNSILDLLLNSKPETEPANQINNLLSDAVETEIESAELDCNLENENDRQTDGNFGDKKLPENSEGEYEENTKSIEDKITITTNPMSEISENLNFSPKNKLEAEEIKDSLEDVNSISEILQTNPEISELESAVKFLRESEEQNELETSLLPKALDESVNELTQAEDFSAAYISDQKISQDLPESEPEFETIASESIAISEAEIISEAAKLESEKKQLNEESRLLIIQNSNLEVNEREEFPETPVEQVNEKAEESAVNLNFEVNPSQCLLTKKSLVIPKTSILEDRLKEPPKIEIPMVESVRTCDSPMTPRSNLLIPQDAKMPNYDQVLESSKAEADKIKEESRIIDSMRKDSERHEVENISSPSRIILKIAKSAIASCGEPKSPKSPKIRSATDSPNPEDSPGQKLEKIKLKLSKSGHPSIIPNELAKETSMQWHTESSSSLSPLGMKRKFSSVQQETKDPSKHKAESITDSPKRTDSPIAMKIKLSKSGDASIIQSDTQDDELKEMKIKEKIDFSHESKRTESPVGVKIKRLKTGDPAIGSCDSEDGNNSKTKEKRDTQDSQKRTDSPIAVKMKLSKTGGASIITVDSTSECKDKLEIPEVPRRTESPLGTKIIKMSKTGDASIIYSEVCNDQSNKGFESSQTCGSFEPSTSKDVDSNAASKKLESSLAVKIKMSKDGEATIVHSEKQSDGQQVVEIHEEYINKTHKSGDSARIESMKIKVPKSGHPMIVTNDTELLYNKDSSEIQCTFIQKREQLTNRSEVTIEPITFGRKQEELAEASLKRKDATPSSFEPKKTKLEAKLSQILPEVTIQPIVPKEQPQHQNQGEYSESAASLISREQMNVINQEISITQVKLAKPSSDIIGEKLKSMLTQSSNNLSDDCEIIEQDPELIIVNENSNSSQDIMIIDEVTPIRVPDVKIPKKRGRPRRNALPFPRPEAVEVNQDPLAIDDSPYIVGSAEPKENERPKRTCRSQKSYAPPKRGRGRGRGKRKFDRSEIGISKKARLEQNLTAIENSTTALITLDEESTSSELQNDSSELYKALRQPLKVVSDHLKKANDSNIKDSKESSSIPDHQNWLTPLSKKQIDNNRNDGISMVQVMDEETRMSAESVSRSQTPARNIPNQETIINEESQGSVISTATTESEKVKVKNRRMEINFDPDEGPFTVEKIAEYEWPLDRKGETFMIQEQISQYLGVKSFKRKYPDLKRRMVDMEERNYLRENLLVNEAMCDMGLTAICSSEVLDIMCSDFPDQYEEYRKHMREKQIKEHSKKQKELTAAANAEKNRIDLAEMAVQSALSWNVNFNKARNESRRCSLDLQTFTIHVPTKQPKINDENKISHYPVALIPGQYTDYYREYTPAELRYYPLNTVLYGPMRPNERKFDSQSEGSQSDSDSDSSSDDSSCSSSEGTQDTEESQSTMDDVDIELSNQKDKSFKCKMCLKHLNKNNKTEVLIQCGTCHGHVHPSCLDLTLDMVPHIHAYAWQCTDCKTCAQCHDPADEDKMLFCDMCDRGYHIYCVGLRRVPQGRWHCQECAICASCGSREAGGMNADRNSVAQWQHEYKKGDKNTRVYVSTLCVPCSKLWRKGRYCPHCSRCHTVSRLDVEENLVHCSACDKYLHLECVENKITDKKNYQCDVCMQNRQRIKSSVSKVIRA